MHKRLHVCVYVVSAQAPAYVCVYVYMCVCMYVCMCVCMYICMCICVYVCVCVYNTPLRKLRYICVYVHTYAPAQHVGMSVCVCIYMCVCVCHEPLRNLKYICVYVHTYAPAQHVVHVCVCVIM